ncbi:hypothetical protein A0H81_11002 [Grifola frondosa]|uniref:Uncharacterized protein n=1 Tax=Grifola frondosa TaxID=5627 RepID=A0A1C7LXG0_GRIFR|nr:hypothetical protein A0H81_11002 [Grifola frondosa]
MPAPSRAALSAASHKEDFDGNFDPDRVVGHGGGGTLPNVDLAADDNVTPYNYTPSGFQGSSSPTVSGGAAGVGAGQGQMRQFPAAVPAFLAGGVAGAAAGAAGAGRPSPPPTSAPSQYSQYSQSQSHSQSHYAPSSEQPYPDYAAYAALASPQAGAADISGVNTYGALRHPSPGPSLPQTDSGSNSGSNSASGAGAGALGVLPSAKEREAAAGRMQVTNAGIVQHTDGIRARSGKGFFVVWVAGAVSRFTFLPPFCLFVFFPFFYPLLSPALSCYPYLSCGVMRIHESPSQLRCIFTQRLK